jgi:hypothetical protein
MERIDGAAFRDDVVNAVYDVVPRAAMPVVVSREVEDARALHIERDIEIAGELVEEVTGIGTFIAPAAIIGAAHVSARYDPLIGPSFPQPVRIEPDWDDRGIYSLSLGCHVPGCQ